jgi:glycine cleavage system H protein
VNFCAYTFSCGPLPSAAPAQKIQRRKRGIYMSNVPADLHYTAEHEWVTAAGTEGVVRIGITDFAQDALGDVVYVQIPETGTTITANDVVGEVESTKSVSDIYAPVTGEVVASNDALESDPALINSDPYGEGWLMEIRLADASATESLLSASEYEQQVG